MIFVDEIDALTGARSDGENDSIRRIKTEFLIQVIKRPTIFARSRQQLAYSCELRMIQMTAAASGRTQPCPEGNSGSGVLLLARG